MEEVEKNFFSEVDKQRQNLRTPWLVMILILVIIFGGCVWGLVKVRHSLRNLSFEGYIPDVNIPKLTLSSKISDLAKNAGNSFTIDANSLELSAYLDLGSDSFPLKNTYSLVKQDKVVLYGRLKSSRLGLPVSVTLKPQVESGQVVFVSQPTDVEKIYMPEETRNQIAAEVTKRLAFDLNLSGGFAAQSVTATDNNLSILMVRK